MMAIVVRGDALSEVDVRKAFDQIEEVDVVVSTIGGTPGDPTADSQVRGAIHRERHAPNYPSSCQEFSGCSICTLGVAEETD